MPRCRKAKQGAGLKQGKRGQRTKAQKKRKALKLAKAPLLFCPTTPACAEMSPVARCADGSFSVCLQALSHADRKGVSHSRKVASTAVKKDLKKLWTTEKKAAPVIPEQ